MIVCASLWRTACEIACGLGLLDCFKLLRRHNPEEELWSSTRAAENGHTEILQYLHDNGSRWCEYTIASAALGGSLKAVKYLHQRGCPWNERACDHAAMAGSLECLMYLHKNGCPWSKEAIDNAAFRHFDCVQYLLTNGCPYDHKTTSSAVINGRLDILQYLHDNNCPWDVTATHNAAHGGHLNCLQYLYAHGCPWDKTTTLNAAKRGQLSCLSYCIQNGCPYEKRAVLLAAASCGSVECLKYLVEQQHVNIKSTKNVFEKAFLNLHLPVIKYLVEIDYPFRGYKFAPRFDYYTNLTDADLLACIQYAVEHGWDYNQELYDFITEPGEINDTFMEFPLCKAYLDEREQGMEM